MRVINYMSIWIRCIWYSDREFNYMIRQIWCVILFSTTISQDSPTRYHKFVNTNWGYIMRPWNIPTNPLPSFCLLRRASFPGCPGSKRYIDLDLCFWLAKPRDRPQLNLRQKRLQEERGFLMRPLVGHPCKQRRSDDRALRIWRPSEALRLVVARQDPVMRYDCDFRIMITDA